MLDALKNEQNRTFTENGAATLRSTLNECLDIFATIGALRTANSQECITRYFVNAVLVTGCPDLC